MNFHVQSSIPPKEFIMLLNLSKSIDRRAVTLSAVALPLVLSIASEAIASKANFRIVNDTSQTIRELYISDSSRDSWGNDILGRDVLPSGSSVGIDFADTSNRVCLYDIRVIPTSGRAFEDYRINVCTST
ncbi:MAG: hypothetical protein HC886_15285 [Leptolyngbyaceae cyanobacterium SM1_1_3]|nr:hypothetical protein [Leptolyngbyaceae cyanobacterium SM1_1_3]